MIIHIDSLEGYEDFIFLISHDSKLTDPHFIYDKGNLYDAFRKQHQTVFASKQDDNVTGIFVWSITEEERYAEMIIGFVQTESAMYEMLDFMEENYNGYQADFVINPRNELIRNVLKEKNAHFDPEQQRLLHNGKGIFPVSGCVEEYSSKRKEEYCSMHSTEAYWTAEKVLSNPDTFRVLLAIENGKAVGYLDVTRCFDRNEPYDLYVKPEHSNKGYEKALLESALKLNCPKTMMVLVDVDNAEEIELYESVGFEAMKGQNSIYATYTL